MAAETYDFVIVGGGTAGLTVATRLSEDPSLSILVLEAGNDHSSDLNVLAPGLFPIMYGNPDYDWDYKTTPQPQAADRIFAHIRGKQLGGSSAMNFMFWTHPSQRDIDNWGALGSPGWSWRELAPYFAKSERYVAPSAQTAADLRAGYVDPAAHGRSGPITSTFPDSYGPITEAWPRTYENLGLGVKSDPRKGFALGGYTNLVNIDTATHVRSYAANVYYLPVAGRPNLKVLTAAHTLKILFETRGRDRVASGVKYAKDGQTVTVSARKEVILAAGSIASPQILELSGIGGKKLLTKLGVPVVVDNANVGENLQDHLYVPTGYRVNPGVPTLEDFRNETFFTAALNQYLADKTGPLSTAGASSALLSLAQIGATSKDINTHAEAAKSSTNNLGHIAQTALLLKDLATEAVAQELTIGGGISPQFSHDTTKLFSTTSEGNFLSILGVLEHPFSRGSVHASSPDPLVHPTIDPRYLSHPLDIKLLSIIALHLRTIATTAPLSDLLAGGGTVLQPGYVDLTPQNVEKWIRENAQSEYHPVGTCAMMPKAVGGVVDEKLRVYGVKGLRVVDASIFPLVPRANIQSLVYAVAERAADFIKTDW
ncbi:GMC oxidoreductase [Plectosphaerella plurivora]|uniref:GMC oxidoreductase n=1 Tax=Plectosphaerella plurivora TaxID=936078 RepID=A0A9P8V401_9PEZI|nr:GMC oxidoreductase [Plectosphaerella plurivora]